ncbi:hypothetical protein BDW62DRAFT_192806 [Aspergillus aurantiobrunneus]
MNDPVPPIVIGIDFGGTSSSAAFALRDSVDRGLQVLDKWPDAVKRSFDGIPRGPDIQTIVYYNSQNDEVLGWSGGEDEVWTAQGYQKPGVLVTPDFKGRLLPPEDSSEEAKRLSQVYRKSIEDITADFLRSLRGSVCGQVQDAVGALGMAADVVQFVVTIPAFWDDEAKAEFQDIAATAGFDSDACKLSCISGLEAALLHAEYTSPLSFKVGDSFLVLDSGGDLVEASIYEINTKEPLSVERRTDVSVASCGSAEVVRHFMAILGSKIGKMGFLPPGRVKGALRHRSKRAFVKEVLLAEGLGNAGFEFELPPEVPGGFWVVDLGVEIDCPEADLIEGYMAFSEEEVYSCFDAAVGKTLELVRDQIEGFQEQNHKPQGCLLAGGFNRCDYYSSRVQTGIASYGLEIIGAGDDAVAFAKGATLAGLQD